jgi:hypothetical protein
LDCQKYGTRCTPEHCLTPRCPRCRAVSHGLSRCSEACQKCGEVKEDCTATWCVLDKRCTRCLAYGRDYHPLKECPEPCDQCGLVDSWCDYGRCLTTCQRCGEHHLTRQCSTPCRQCGLKGGCGKECATKCFRCDRVGHTSKACSPKTAKPRPRLQPQPQPQALPKLGSTVDFPVLC